MFKKTNKWTDYQPPYRPAPEPARCLTRTQLFALAVPAAFAVYRFGLPALQLMAAAAVTALVTERIAIKFSHERSFGTTAHSIMMGLLLSFTLPAFCPWYLAVLGTVLAIAVGKHLFGGMGHYLWHPALVGRISLHLLFGRQLSAPTESLASDMAGTAAPLEALRNFENLKITENVPQLSQYLLENLPSLEDCLWGRIPGGIGEICACVLILLTLFWLYRGYVHWHLPAFFILSAYITAALCPIVTDLPELERHVIPWPILAENLQTGLTYINYHILLGGMLLGAGILGTDMTSRPVTRRGQAIFALFAGCLTIIFRLYTTVALPCFTAILIMNTFRPLIDRFTRPPSKYTR